MNQQRGSFRDRNLWDATGSRGFRVAVGFLVLLGLLVLICRTAISDETKSQQGFRPKALNAIDQAITKAIEAGRCPGAVFWLEHGGMSYHRAYGRRAILPEAELMTEDTIFDAASLTKVLATTPAVMKLIEQGKVELDAPVSRYLPEFAAHGKQPVTVRHLLTHTSGLPPGLPPNPPWRGGEKALALADESHLSAAPGSAFRYSDINFLLLGEIVRKVSGRTLNEFCAEEIYRPLSMNDTGFLPAESLRSRIAPTEHAEDGTFLRGIVHDPTARRMGGVAGHAGLFTTARDVAKFARMMLDRGTVDGGQIFDPSTVNLMTTVQTPPGVKDRRGLGWDIDSPYAGPRGERFPLGSYGHTGWTGGALWIDPFSDTFMIFLTNRNHPDGTGNVVGLWKQLGTFSAEAVLDFDFEHASGVPPALQR